MNQLTDLAIALQKELAILPAKSNAMAKQAANAIIQDLALHTPVDQGTAVSNWQVTLDTPATTEIPALAPSPKGRNSSGTWQHSVSPDVTRENNASLLLSSASEVIAAKQPGQTLYIVNNLPYIELLNEGSSEQAPAGFVDRAQVLAQSVIDSA